MNKLELLTTAYKTKKILIKASRRPAALSDAVVELSYNLIDIKKLNLRNSTNLADISFSRYNSNFIFSLVFSIFLYLLSLAATIIEIVLNIAIRYFIRIVYAFQVFLGFGIAALEDGDVSPNVNIAYQHTYFDDNDNTYYVFSGDVVEEMQKLDLQILDLLMAISLDDVLSDKMDKTQALVYLSYINSQVDFSINVYGGHQCDTLVFIKNHVTTITQHIISKNPSQVDFSSAA